jgi:predicted permease
MIHLFRRNRALTAVVIGTLSLGVGMSAAMFNLVDVLLFRPPAHITDPERLVEVPAANNYVRYVRLQRRIQSLELAGYTRLPITLGSVPDTSVLRAECVTGNYFQLLGVTPIVGRTFSSDETIADGTPPAIVSYGLWRRLFGGTANALDARVDLAGRRHRVVGVAPAGFTGVRLEPVDVWLALTQSPEACSFTGGSLLSSSYSAWLSTVGRLRDQFTLEQVAFEIPPLDADRLDAGTAPEPAVRPLATSRRARLTQDGRMALWLAGGALLVLLIACANVAVLLALRAWERRLEVAIRLKLGATARRVFGLLFAENLALALLCIAGAAVVVVWVDTALRAFFPTLPDARMNLRSFGIVAGFAVFAGLTAAVVPAVQVARSDAALLLRGGHQVIAGGSRTRATLLVLQLAFAQVLLVGSGLFGRSVDNLLTGAGFDIRQILVVTVELEKHGYPVAETWTRIDAFVERARSIDGVVGVGVSSDTLLNSGGMTVGVDIKPSQAQGVRETQSMNAVSPDYFATLGTRIVRGRGFVAGDDANARPVVIIDEALARADWPGQDPLGQCAYIGSRPDCIEIVGISESRRSTFLNRLRKEFFVPAAQAWPYKLHTTPRTIFVRSRVPVRQIMPSLVAALHSVAPEVPRSNVRPLLDLADEGTKSWRLGAQLFSLFGVTAAVMSGVGLYAALALMVRQRTAEIAVRMVLGATPGTVIGLVIRHVAALLESGCLIGVMLVLLMGRLVERLLFAVAPSDPGILAGVAALLCATAVLGSVLPAIRAARLNPSAALRQ